MAYHLDGLAQHWNNSIDSTLKLLHFQTKPSFWIHLDFQLYSDSAKTRPDKRRYYLHHNTISSSQIPERIKKYATMHHFVTEAYISVHISITMWCIVAYD